MNSQKKICRAERSRVMAVSRMMVEREHPARCYHHPKERRWQKHFPAQAHQLIVAIARHYGLRHRKEKEEEDDRGQKPEDSRHRRERPDAERREPAAEEKDRAHRAHQNDADIFTQEEEEKWGR